MAGHSFNLVWTKKTRIGHDILEKHKGQKSWCAHMCIVCECGVCVCSILCIVVCVHYSICTRTYIYMAVIDGND